jgi:hypothetical protein
MEIDQEVKIDRGVNGWFGKLVAAATAMLESRSIDDILQYCALYHEELKNLEATRRTVGAQINKSYAKLVKTMLTWMIQQGIDGVYGPIWKPQLEQGGSRSTVGASDASAAGTALSTKRRALTSAAGGSVVHEVAADEEDAEERHIYVRVIRRKVSRQVVTSRDIVDCVAKLKRPEIQKTLSELNIEAWKEVKAWADTQARAYAATSAETLQFIASMIHATLSMMSKAGGGTAPRSTGAAKGKVGNAAPAGVHFPKTKPAIASLYRLAVSTGMYRPKHAATGQDMSMCDNILCGSGSMLVGDTCDGGAVLSNSTAPSAAIAVSTTAFHGGGDGVVGGGGGGSALCGNLLTSHLSTINESGTCSSHSLSHQPDFAGADATDRRSAVGGSIGGGNSVVLDFSEGDSDGDDDGDGDRSCRMSVGTACSRGSLSRSRGGRRSTTGSTKSTSSSCGFRVPNKREEALLCAFQSHEHSIIDFNGTAYDGLFSIFELYMQDMQKAEVFKKYGSIVAKAVAQWSERLGIDGQQFVEDEQVEDAGAGAAAGTTVTGVQDGAGWSHGGGSDDDTTATVLVPVPEGITVCGQQWVSTNARRAAAAAACTPIVTPPLVVDDTGLIHKRALKDDGRTDGAVAAAVNPPTTLDALVDASNKPCSAAHAAEMQQYLAYNQFVDVVAGVIAQQMQHCMRKVRAKLDISDKPGRCAVVNAAELGDGVLKCVIKLQRLLHDRKQVAEQFANKMAGCRVWKEACMPFIKKHYAARGIHQQRIPILVRGEDPCKALVADSQLADTSATSHTTNAAIADTPAPAPVALNEDGMHGESGQSRLAQAEATLPSNVDGSTRTAVAMPEGCGALTTCCDSDCGRSVGGAAVASISSRKPCLHEDLNPVDSELESAKYHHHQVAGSARVGSGAIDGEEDDALEDVDEGIDLDSIQQGGSCGGATSGILDHKRQQPVTTALLSDVANQFTCDASSICSFMDQWDARSSVLSITASAASGGEGGGYSGGGGGRGNAGTMVITGTNTCAERADGDTCASPATATNQRGSTSDHANAERHVVIAEEDTVWPCYIFWFREGG